ncbi:hypothetical protein VTO42DRAFT_3256 [Malbranchea cinnamomea]
MGWGPLGKMLAAGCGSQGRHRPSKAWTIATERTRSSTDAEKRWPRNDVNREHQLLPAEVPHPALKEGNLHSAVRCPYG